MYDSRTLNPFRGGMSLETNVINLLLVQLPCYSTENPFMDHYSPYIYKEDTAKKVDKLINQPSQGGLNWIEY